VSKLLFSGILRDIDHYKSSAENALGVVLLNRRNVLNKRTEKIAQPCWHRLIFWGADFSPLTLILYWVD
jgi:hypothetical protein